MKPTNELRFVERQEAVPMPEHPTTGKLVIRRILQQKWATYNQNVIVEQEWRDVPIEKESK